MVVDIPPLVVVVVVASQNFFSTVLDNYKIHNDISPYIGDPIWNGYR